MRLITTFDTEKEAYAFYSFLLKEGVQAIYESQGDIKMGKKVYPLWIYEEEDWENTLLWLKEFKENPLAPHFTQEKGTLAAPPQPPLFRKESVERLAPPLTRPVISFSLTLTRLLFLLCVALFVWNAVAEHRLSGAYIPTSLEKALLFDTPQPEAKGLFLFHSTSLFEKMREGQLWRLFTPCLLHADFLHLLFNMSWLLFLGKQIEGKIRPFKMGLLILLLGCVSNVAQYLVSGPFFLGFSGVIVGMAAFIWMRQRLASKEGYKINRSALHFLFLFVIAMCVFEGIAWLLNAFAVLHMAPPIANTAHVVGGLTGLALGRLPFFATSQESFR